MVILIIIEINSRLTNLFQEHIPDRNIRNKNRNINKSAFYQLRIYPIIIYVKHERMVNHMKVLLGGKRPLDI